MYILCALLAERMATERTWYYYLYREVYIDIKIIIINGIKSSGYIKCFPSHRPCTTVQIIPTIGVIRK